MTMEIKFPWKAGVLFNTQFVESEMRYRDPTEAVLGALDTLLDHLPTVNYDAEQIREVLGAFARVQSVIAADAGRRKYNALGDPDYMTATTEGWSYGVQVERVDPDSE